MPNSREHLLLLGTLWAIAIANMAAVQVPARTWHGGNDFLSFYAGGVLATNSGLYDHREIRRVQQTAAGWDSAELAFVRPPFYAVLLSPFGRIPYPLAYQVWMVLMAAASIMSLFLLHRWIPWWWSLPALLSSAPAYAAFVNGQDVPLLLAVLTGFWRLYRSGRVPVVAGLLLSLCAVKFHLFAAIPLFLIRRRDWRVGQGVLIGLGLLLVISFAAQGWGWPWRYAAQISAPSISPSEAAMPNWHGSLHRLPWVVEAGVCVATFVVAWVAVARSTPVGEAFAIALLAGFLVSHHAYLQDGVILMPALLLLVLSGSDVVTRGLAFLALTPFPWILLGSENVRTAVPMILALLMVAACFDSKGKEAATTPVS